MVNNLPNVLVLTLARVRVVSLRFAPLRALSWCWVQTGRGAAWRAKESKEQANERTLKQIAIEGLQGY
jgi:hypothetical protein